LNAHAWVVVVADSAIDVRAGGVGFLFTLVNKLWDTYAEREQRGLRGKWATILGGTKRTML
jgi:hypothetical protein